MFHSNPSQANMSAFANEPEVQRSARYIHNIDLSLLRMPRSSEEKPPLAKYRRVEINPITQELDINIADLRISQMPRSPTSLNCTSSTIPSLEMRPQLVSADVGRTEDQGSSESVMIGQPIPKGSLNQWPWPTNLSLNDVIVIDDSSDEEVAASHSINFSERIRSKKIFSTSDFLKDGFIENLRRKLALEREHMDNKCSEVIRRIEHLTSGRRAHERARLEKISKFQFAKCPIYLADSVEELMPLTKSQEQRHDKILLGSPCEILTFKFNLLLKRCDILTVVDTNWLNDKVINFYMNLLMERSKERVGELPSVYAMNTYFLQRLRLSGYAGVSRWTRNVDLFTKDIIPVPVHHEKAHWGMAIIHMRNKTIRYYDSMDEPNQPVLDALESYLQQESLDKRQLPFDTSGFKIESVPNVPQQTNGYDCGVFSCMFAEYITRGATINFGQKSIGYFRQRMVLEIIDGKLWN